ncbi:hypothetical protein Bca4012_052049 [Brassica carinata]
MKKEYKTDASMGQTQGVDSKGKGKEVSGSMVEPRHGTKHGVVSKGKGKEVSGSLMGQNQSVGEIITGPSPFDDLPEDCISNIVAFTSPRNACVSSSVSKTFESAARSDSVWEKFLPLDYTSLAPASRAFSSKRELYFALCDHFLIEDGKKSFWLEKGSGKKCVMLAARALWITWGSSPEYWQWISMPESRFEEVAELRNVCAFGMGGTMNTQVLSPGSHYSAYFVYKIRNRRHGFRDLPIQVGVGFKGQDMPKNFICFDVSNDVNKQWPRKELMKSEKREDGWIEAEIGDFFNEEGCDEIESFWLDKASGKKCIMLSAKELAITWGNSPQHWQWISNPESRFEKVAELLSVWWFEIRGKMNTRLLSLGTRYSAYIVFKTVNKCPGLADLPVEVGVGLVGQEIPKQLIYFDGYMDKDARKVRGELIYFDGYMDKDARKVRGEMRDVMKPKKREDGWMEAELGEFFNEKGCYEVELSVIEIKSPYWKCGITSRNFTIENKCDYTVWPAASNGPGGISLSTTGFMLRKGEARVINAPFSWTGRFWGRTFCSTNSTGSFSCATGDCGTGKVDCGGAGVSLLPATLAEFALDNSGKDYYDVSVIDGYNLPILVVPQGDKTCSSTGCVVDMNVTCPFELRVTANTSMIACMNACQKLKLPEYCCTGNYSTPDKCKPSLYSQNFKSVCPRAYSYTYDDASSSTFLCASNKSNYAITFCPSTILNTTK